MRERPTARIILLDPDDRALMFHFVHERGILAGQRHWATPGGGIAAGESPQAAAARELREETGFDLPLSDVIATREVDFKLESGELLRAHESYFAAFAPHERIDKTRWNAFERRVMQDHRWWGLEDLATTSETYFPENMAGMIARARALRP
ncbi:NUDIX hydrolase [Abyssibius alkaniclasticus]|uniref:NUDIX hydrolase n=1 Tax=Abyssibius alkaniclasticus TaxID=2881234 RepID=UPI0040587160